MLFVNFIFGDIVATEVLSESGSPFSIIRTHTRCNIQYIKLQISIRDINNRTTPRIDVLRSASRLCPTGRSMN